MAHATLNQPYPLRAQLADANAALFPRAVVYNEAGAVVGSVDLSPILGGLYGASYTFASEGYFSVVYTMYADAGHTVVAPYDREAEQVEVTASLPASVWDALVEDHLGAETMGEALAIVRGLLQYNYTLDNPTYNSAGLLTSGRIRVFKSKADTDAGINPIASFTISGTAQPAPSEGLGQTLKVTRNP